METRVSVYGKHVCHAAWVPGGVTPPSARINPQALLVSLHYATFRFVIVALLVFFVLINLYYASLAANQGNFNLTLQLVHTVTRTNNEALH